MADWPNAMRGSRMATIGVPSNSRGVTVTAGAANTKGSYAELSSSTPWDADGFILNVFPAVAASDFLLDIAVGAGGSEVVMLPDFFFYSNTTSVGEVRFTVQIYIPLPIKAGTRVAARCQSNTASATASVSLTLCAGDFYSSLRFGRTTSYGFSAGTTVGTTVDPGGTANTKGSYVQLASAIANPICGYALLSFSGRRNAAMAAETALLDIAVGAAASEQVVVADLPYGASSLDWCVPPAISVFMTAKAGERLAARAQSTLTDATDRLKDLVVMGFD